MCVLIYVMMQNHLILYKNYKIINIEHTNNLHGMNSCIAWIDIKIKLVT